jgi:hypothetical protein
MCSGDVLVLVLVSVKVLAFLRVNKQLHLPVGLYSVLAGVVKFFFFVFLQSMRVNKQLHLVDSAELFRPHHHLINPTYRLVH